MWEGLVKTPGNPHGPWQPPSVRLSCPNLRARSPSRANTSERSLEETQPQSTSRRSIEPSPHLFRDVLFADVCQLFVWRTHRPRGHSAAAEGPTHAGSVPGSQCAGGHLGSKAPGTQTPRPQAPPCSTRQRRLRAGVCLTRFQGASPRGGRLSCGGRVPALNPSSYSWLSCILPATAPLWASGLSPASRGS